MELITVVSERYYRYWSKLKDLNKTSSWIDQTSIYLRKLGDFWRSQR